MGGHAGGDDVVQQRGLHRPMLSNYIQLRPPRVRDAFAILPIGKGVINRQRGSRHNLCLGCLGSSSDGNVENRERRRIGQQRDTQRMRESERETERVRERERVQGGLLWACYSSIDLHCVRWVVHFHDKALGLRLKKSFSSCMTELLVSPLSFLFHNTEVSLAIGFQLNLEL